METDSDLIESIKACRTCGIHYVSPSNHQLKHLFQSCLEHSEIMLIRSELAKWNVEVAENDGYPQYVCNSCIHRFEQVFELRAACVNAQNEFRKFYNVPNGNFANIQVKTERPDVDEEQKICDFIYVDELSDTEYDGATPFNVPHVPIKDEVIEAATIPMEESQQPTNIVDSASSVVLLTDPSSSLIPPGQMLQNESVDVSPPAQLAVNQVVCKLCQHISPNDEDHEQHLQRAHEIRDMECHICGKEFKNSTSARLKFHMKWHTLNKHVKCVLCGFMCNSKDALKEHKRANHGKINCKICGKGVFAKKMKFHLRQHELLPKHCCEYCAETFTTGNDLENHIWQIHGNENSNIHINQNLVTSKLNDSMLGEQQGDIFNHKFLCAHCEQSFIEQIDLETHVKNEHRFRTHLPYVEAQTAATFEEPLINNGAKMAQLATEYEDEHTNITVFEDYDDAEIHIPVIDDAIMNNGSSMDSQSIDSNFLQTSTSSSHFISQTEDMESGYNEERREPSEVTTEYHTEKALNNSTANEEYTDVIDSEDEVGCNVLPAFVENNFNTFACAKCTDTFVTIEQLRQHYELHNIAANQSRNTTTSKSKFKCNLCGKSFDLKFSLNRHIQKHKHAPI